jgi:hypothetical protein
MLESDGQANEVRRNSRGDLLGGGELLVGRCRGMNGQRLRVTDVRDVTRELERVDEPPPGFCPSLYSEAEDTPPS